eukprot:TRINITY_DN9949_c0_g2_i1.p1 TRINITY_DN9949_c0_g2~~TRINITY_DN9949_c0_g2_i1.p1  ORF type:complete len:737 (+),score=139.93 TRINITY_DN9949_c0_g2_i1:73-2283(+)
MDPLALLSEDEEEEQEVTEKRQAQENKGHSESTTAVPDVQVAPSPKRRRHDEGSDGSAVTFQELISHGYEAPLPLASSDPQYLQDAAGQDGRRPKAPLPEGSWWERRFGDRPSDDPAVAAVLRRLEASEGGASEVSQPVVSVVAGSTPVPAPWEGFDELPERLRESLQADGFYRPTVVQAYAWPAITTGRDVVGIASTGAGKTLAFLVPCCARSANHHHDALRGLAAATSGEEAATALAALIVVPSRELALQIAAEAERFRRGFGVRLETILGGASKVQQLAGLRGRPQLVVATPGKLNDIRASDADARRFLQSARMLVLDETDRCLDAGLEAQVGELLEAMEGSAGKRAQRLLFAATWPDEVQALAGQLLHDPIQVHVGHPSEHGRSRPTILQDVVFCDEKREDSKRVALLQILDAQPRARTIVFTCTKASCKALFAEARRGIRGRCKMLHGGMTLEDRTAALQELRSGEARVLITTDVVARGVDIKGIDLVINFDPPRSPQDYVNRIGRTGRAGYSGAAVSLLVYFLEGDGMQNVAEGMKRTGAPIPSELAHRLGPALPDWQPSGRVLEQRAGRHFRMLLEDAANQQPELSLDAGATKPPDFGNVHAPNEVSEQHVDVSFQPISEAPGKGHGHAAKVEAACCQCDEPALADWRCSQCQHRMCKDCHRAGTSSGFPADRCWHCGPSGAKSQLRWSIDQLRLKQISEQRLLPAMRSPLLVVIMSMRRYRANTCMAL